MLNLSWTYEGNTFDITETTYEVASSLLALLNSGVSEVRVTLIGTEN